MAGANIRCGEFEGEDKSGSPALAVLTGAYCRVFHRKPRGRVALALTAITRDKRSGVEALAEAALLSVKYDEIGKIPADVCSCLLADLKNYQKTVLDRLSVSDDVEEIFSKMAKTKGAKYGRTHDDGWHAYCLHDLVPAFERSVNTRKPVKIVW